MLVVIIHSLLPFDLDAHNTLYEIIILEVHKTLLRYIPSSKTFSESSEFHTAGNVIIKCNLSTSAVSPCDCTHCLWAQSKSHIHQGFLQFLTVHCTTSIIVKSYEVLLPAIDHSPEFFKFIKSQRARHIPIQH